MNVFVAKFALCNCISASSKKVNRLSCISRHFVSFDKNIPAIIAKNVEKVFAKLFLLAVKYTAATGLRNSRSSAIRFSSC